MSRTKHAPYCQNCPHHARRHPDQGGNSIEVWEGNRGIRVIGRFAIVAAVLGASTFALIQRLAPLPANPSVPPVTVVIA